MRENYWTDLRSGRIGRRRLLAGAGTMGAGLAGLALIGCGGGSKQAASTATAAAPKAGAPAATTAAASTPKKGGTTRVVIGVAAPATLNPVGGTAQSQYHMGFIASRLYKNKTDTNPLTWARYEIEPDLALSFEQVDPLTTTFHLRPGVTLHEGPPTNGRAFTADDVVYHFTQFKQKGSRRTDLNYVKSIEAPDAKTVTFKLSEARSDFVNYMAYPASSLIAPKEMWDSQTAWDTTPKGTGPFILDRWDKAGGALFYSRNPKYYAATIPYVDKVEGLFIADTRTILARLRAGEIDYTHSASLSNPEIESSGLKKAVFGPSASGRALAFDGRTGFKKPFDDVRVRRAVQLAIDREGTIKSLYKGKGATLQPMLSAAMAERWGLPANDPTWAQWVKYDPAQAKQLLSAAGYDGKPVDFNYTSVYGDAFVTECEGIAAFMDPIGLKTTIRVTEGNDYLVNVLRGPRGYTGMGVFGVTSYTDPTNYFQIYLDVDNSAYNFRTKDDAAFALYNKQKTIYNEAERKAVVQDLLRRVVDQAFFPPLPFGFGGSAVADRVQGLTWTASFGFGTETVAKYWLDPQ